jgi:hypothetical protein
MDLDHQEIPQLQPDAAIEGSATAPTPAIDPTKAMRDRVFDMIPGIMLPGAPKFMDILNTVHKTVGTDASGEGVAAAVSKKQDLNKEMGGLPNSSDEAKVGAMLQVVLDRMQAASLSQEEIMKLFSGLMTPLKTRPRAELTTQDLDEIRFMQMGNNGVVSPFGLAAKIKEFRQAELDEQYKYELSTELKSREYLTEVIKTIVEGKNAERDAYRAILPSAMQMDLDTQRRKGAYPKHITEMLTKAEGLKNADDKATAYLSVARLFQAEAAAIAASDPAQAQIYSNLAQSYAASAAELKANPNANQQATIAKAGLDQSRAKWFDQLPELMKSRDVAKYAHESSLHRQRMAVLREGIASRSKSDADKIKMLKAALAVTQAGKPTYSAALKSAESERAELSKKIAGLEKGAFGMKGVPSDPVLLGEYNAYDEDLKFVRSIMQDLLGVDDGQGN